MTSRARVGILTFLHTLNYGALLQAYALQKVLKDNGFHAVQIDYRNSAIEAFEFKKAKTIRARVANIVRRPIINKKSLGFSAFQRENIEATEPLSKDDLEQTFNEFDYLVVGSDQVWNGFVTGFDTSFFLDAANMADRKRTYAVSIGQDTFPTRSDVDYVGLLQSFPRILVRERTAVKALRPYYPTMPIDVVLDPTLLARRIIWLDLAAKECAPRVRPYVFVYAVGETKRSVECAREIARARHLDVVVLQQNGFLPFPGVKNIFAISPAEFLSYIAHAEIVVTSSFHGLCLSLQMEREFYVSYAASGVKRNSRMVDLLEELGLSDRANIGSWPHLPPINWNIVRARLEQMRKRSLSLLLESLDAKE